PMDKQSLGPVAIYFMGVAYARTGQVEAGKQLFSQLLSNNSTRAQASFLLGKGYYDSKLFEQAEQSFKDVLQMDPQFPGAHRELEARAALHRFSELHTTSLEVDRRMHDAMVAGAR